MTKIVPQLIQSVCSVAHRGARSGISLDAEPDRPWCVRAEAESRPTKVFGDHDTADEVWIKVHKVASGLPSITPKQAVDVVLCWGWIDAIRKGFDDKSFMQRYTPRSEKSVWSQRKVEAFVAMLKRGETICPQGKK